MENVKSLKETKIIMERPKCSFCDKPAEYYLPDESGKPKLYFCEEHALEWLKEGKVSYLPKLREEENKV